ncbi:MAG: rhomboid family intramembrane serine protease [Paludibacteraceae bacterium]|nr:rhomboid family intramembrane serine protease [Paludibacteraceae bacterium]
MQRIFKTCFFITLCLLLYIVLGEETLYAMGVSNEHLWGCLTYHFAHSSWSHLVINCIAYVILYKRVLALSVTRFGDERVDFGMFAAATLAGLCASAEIPTVGASGLIFAMLGMILVLNPTVRQLKNYIYVAIAIGIQCFVGNSNTPLHIYAFIYGALFMVIRCAIDKLKIK